jgi:uncharacterized membrane protein
MFELARFVEVVLSHPNHVRLVHFPIAFSYLGLLVVMLAWWRRDAFFDKAAFYTMLLLTLSVIPAGLTGTLENQLIYAGNAPNAAVKITLAVCLLVIAVGATLWRWRQPKILHGSLSGSLYVLAFIICAGLTTLLGALGGIIVWGAWK